MVSNLDLEEQEQLANFRHFWSKYGNLITWVVIVALGAYAGWNGWQYWQRKAAVQASALYDEMERAAQSRDAEKVARVWADVQSQAGSALQAHHAGLLAAQVLAEAGKVGDAKAALGWVIDKSGDDALVAVARLRLAGVELDAQSYEAALKILDTKMPPEFAGLQADRKGDILLAQGKTSEARAAYQQAYQALAAVADYRRMVQAKLNSLGVDPQAAGTTPEASK